MPISNMIRGHSVFCLVNRHFPSHRRFQRQPRTHHDHRIRPYRNGWEVYAAPGVR